MGGKQTELSIVLRTVDRATAGVRAFSSRIDAITKRVKNSVSEATRPMRDFGGSLGGLGKSLGLGVVMDAFKAIGGVVGGLIEKIPLIGAVIGGVVAGAVAGLVHLVNEFDDLGKKAKRMGVTADFLAGMRDAAERTGVPLEALDSGMQAFTTNLGQARAGTGRMAKFLTLAYKPMLDQLKATKDNAAAFDLLADYMSKLQDPAKRAALAQKTLGDPALAETFMKGGAGLKAMREHYLALAGPQAEAVKQSEEAHEAMLDLKASTDGAKASLVTGLAPALKVISARLSAWLSGHREDIKQWAIELGEKLPGAFQKIAEWVEKAFGKLSTFFGVLEKIYDKIHALIHLKELQAENERHDRRFEYYKKAIDPEGRSDAEMQRVIELEMVQEDQLQERLKAQAAGVDWTTAGDTRRFGETDRHSIYSKEELDALAKGVGLGGQSSEGFANQRLINDALDADAPSLRDSPGLFDMPKMIEALKAAVPPVAPADKAKITIEIKNAPPGTRATADPKSTANVDLNMGYQLDLGTP